MLSCAALPATAALKIWLLLTAVALAIHLGGPPLLDADEGRNAEVAREMSETNDYVVPRLNGMPYLDKPIVYFAAEALAMEVLGPTELAARLPAYLFTLATAAAVFWFARKRIGEQQAFVAAAAFLAMPLTIAFARTVIFDSALTFFIVVAIVAFHEAVEERERKWATIAWIAIAFGVLTKGPVAIAVPLMIAIPYAIRRKAFRKLWSIAGALMFVAIIAPWVWAVSREVPDFLHYVLVTETAARMATDELKRTGPPWYFVPYLIAGAAPWSLVALFSALGPRPSALGDISAAVPRAEGRGPRAAFLLLWILVPLVFFSISQSKRPQYILPVMPAVALLVASMWDAIRFRVAAIVAAVFGFLLIGAASMPQLIARMRPEYAAQARTTALVLGALLAIAGLVAALVRSREIAFIALSTPVIAIPIVANSLMDALGERRSARSLVASIQNHLTPQTDVIGVEAFTGSLAFYLRRTMTVATDDGDEFTSNYILRRYDRFAGKPGSPVKPLSWFEANLRECCKARLFIIRDDDPEYRQTLESRGAQRIAKGPHHLVYRFTGEAD